MHSAWYPVAGALFIAFLAWFAWVTAWRRAVAALPPAVSPLLLTGKQDGRPVYRMRVQLGLGRRIQSGLARAVWRDGDEEVPLEVLVPRVKNVVGPWTIVACDARARDRGEVVLTAELKEGRRLHPISQVFPLARAQPGRFGGLTVDGGVRWDPERFSAIEVDVTPPAELPDASS
jgi:hypothetical protein